MQHTSTQDRRRTAAEAPPGRAMSTAAGTVPQAVDGGAPDVLATAGRKGRRAELDDVAQTRHDSDLWELPDSEFSAAGQPTPGTLRNSAVHSRYVSAQLAPQPAAPAQARQLTRDCLARWHMPALTDDAEIVASEIVTNALAAVPPGSAGLTIIYALYAHPAGLHIHVWDIGPGQPRRSPTDADAVTGRGLAIIDALTNSNWGWWPTPKSGGKVVYATLTVDAQDTPHDPGHPTDRRRFDPSGAGQHLPDSGPNS